MRIHLGHHFYGAGNLGDDFMLAGFLAATRQLGIRASFTAAVPFPLDPLRQRFPEIEWLPYEPSHRANAIAACDAWLGLGGSPFQHAQSRWFLDHLAADGASCRAAGKPMFYLGVGVQTAAELADSAVRQLCSQATAIWTRDHGSAERLKAVASGPARAGADLAHIHFLTTPLPPARRHHVAVVANFDYGPWPGRDACLTAIEGLGADEHVWLVQEIRELPGAERSLHAALPESTRQRWSLAIPDQPGVPIATATARWPSPEWLVTSRFHAALAGAWSGSRVVVIGINEKLRGAADELGVPLIAPDASQSEVHHALSTARPVSPARLAKLRDQAAGACAEFWRGIVPAVRDATDHVRMN